MSICIPAYNAGEFIMQTIGSILGQTYTNWELIIVNDGSTDNTTQKLRSVCSDDRIKIYSQENRGQCHAANRAFDFSRGSLIKFMDADDLISENLIEKQVLALIDMNEDTISYSLWGRFYNNDLNTFQPDKNFVNDQQNPLEWLIASMTEKQVMLQCGLWLIPRNVLLKSGLWNEKLSLINDFEFFIRVLMNATSLRYAPDAILYYRSGLENSLSKLISDQSIASAFNSIAMGTQYLLQRENSGRVRKICADCFQDFIYAYYPSRMDLIYDAEQKVKQLGGSSAEFPSGSYAKALNRIIGWKLVKKMKIYVSIIK